MATSRTDEIDLVTAEEVVFGSKEKKIVLRLAHKHLLPLIAEAISIKAQQNDHAKSVEDVLDASPGLTNDYTTLLLFQDSDIKNLRANKDAVRNVIKDYINQVLIGFRMGEGNRFEKLANEVKHAIGQSAFLEIYERMKHKQGQYPSNLEIDNLDITSSIRALDIFLHLPDELIANNYLFRLAQKSIEDKMIVVKGGPLKPNPHSFHQSTTSAKPAPKPAPKPAASDNKKNNPFSMFDLENMLGLMPVSKDMKQYKLDMQQYKTDILVLNKQARLYLFSAIAESAKFEKIAAYFLTLKDAAKIKDAFGNSAIHLAALCGRDDLVTLLIENDFDPDGKNERGCSALHLAALSGSAATVRVLLQVGCQLEEKNKDGVDAKEIAEKCSSGEVATLVKDWKAPSYSNKY